MRRTRDIIGLPVLNLQSGLRTGWVQDVVYDEKTNKVTGVILEGSHLFDNGKGIPAHEFAALSKDALTVYHDTPVKMNGICVTSKIGNRVYNQSGDAKGTIQDIYLDNEGKCVVGFEVSDGLLADLLQGRGIVLQKHVMSDSKENLIVEDCAAPWGNTEGGQLS